MENNPTSTLVSYRYSISVIRNVTADDDVITLKSGRMFGTELLLLAL